MGKQPFYLQASTRVIVLVVQHCMDAGGDLFEMRGACSLQLCCCMLPGSGTEHVFTFGRNNLLEVDDVLVFEFLQNLDLSNGCDGELQQRIMSSTS